MSADSERLLPPNEPAAFESLCLDLWKDIWRDPGAQKNGRSGQPQAGVDVFGQHQGRWVGVQCKQKDGLLRTKLTTQELEDEVQKVYAFKPMLSAFILATSGPRDAKVQERARQLTEEHSRRGLFKVEVWSWEDIWHELYQRETLLKRIKPVYWPRLTTLDAPVKIAPTRLSVTGTKFVGRETELQMLDAAWNSAGDRKINIISLIGQGGEGKTAIVLDWYSRCARHGWQDARRVFDWSFYSQGTSAHSAASADEFFGQAFAWFGHTGEVPRDPWTKGEKLAELISAERTLLVLDGLEPLQQPPGDYGGEFKDPAMKALLRALALRNPGLCVLTSRTDVTNLKDFEHAGGSCLRHPLHSLDAEAARQLLCDLGVRGPDPELDEAIAWFKGHAYDLNLLGNYLAQCTSDHEIRRWKETLLLKEDEHVHGQPDASGKKEGHGRRMLHAYERWLGPDTAAVAILRLLGLFDRPARSDLLDELRAAPVIPRLTEALVNLPEDECLRALDQLERLGLIAREQVSARSRATQSSRSKPKRAARPVSYAVDTHPLLREHFAAELRDSNPDAWKAAHRRLYEYLRDSTPDKPEPTLDELQPLYQAVAHGCKAGMQQEACEKVYHDRIQRGREAYSTRKLGAIGADLGAIACFFEQPWTRLLPSLSEPAQSWLLSEAAFRLRGLGRLTEALEPIRAGLEMRVKQDAWDRAAIVAGNLSELELALGEVAGAVRDAKQSVTFADRSGDTVQRMFRRTTVADALHQSGRRHDALARFREAEEMQAKDDPKSPLLYSLRGFEYCDLLLTVPEQAAWQITCSGGLRLPEDPVARRATLQDVEQRAAQTLKWVEAAAMDILSIALDHLTLGRTALYRAVLEHGSLTTSHESLDWAVNGLRRAGYHDHIPRGLLTRAWLRFLEDDPAGAGQDLDEAWEIAGRGSMKLFLADIHLHRARLFHDKEELKKARALIEQCGYWRRKEELEDTEAAIM